MSEPDYLVTVTDVAHHASSAVDDYVEARVDPSLDSGFGTPQSETAYDRFTEAMESLTDACSALGVTVPPAEEENILQRSTVRVFRASEQMGINCMIRDDEEPQPLESFEEAWEQHTVEERELCRWYSPNDPDEPSLSFNEYELTEVEQEAIDLAGYEDVSSIRTLYVICAQSYEDRSSSDDWVQVQAAEVLGAFVLCPEHPDREIVESAVSHWIPWIEAEAWGDVYTGGTYRVNDDIPPGTYVAESVEGFNGCYWERLDTNGNIIANHFQNSGFRTQVTISSSDYSFHSSGCGAWRRIG